VAFVVDRRAVIGAAALAVVEEAAGLCVLLRRRRPARCRSTADQPATPVSMLV
jgi:hypothetical protein